MRKPTVLQQALALIAACAAVNSAVPAGARSERSRAQFASPGKVVAAEVAFAQLAQRKGQWAAFRATAADDAVMFVPQPVVARDWLKSKEEPRYALTWQPHQVFLSCDGSLAVTYGAWQRTDGSQGYFTTVWQRQKRGDYKWVMDQGDDLATALPATDMIGSTIGYCAPGARRSSHAASASAPPAWPAGTRGGWSDDRTLRWAVRVDADCARTTVISLRRSAGRPMEPVLEKRVAGTPSARCPVS